MAWRKEYKKKTVGHRNRPRVLTDISGDERELKRLHMDMISEEELGDGLTPEKALSHYKKLSKEEQDKDVEPMNTMLTLLKLFDGVRIYRLS